MEINLKDIKGHDEMRYRELNMSKSVHLYQEVNSINEEIETKFNFIIMPMNVYSILEGHPSFKEDTIDYEVGIYYVGDLLEFRCYVDLTLPKDQIILRYDKQTSRENKLNSILKDSEMINEMTIKVNDF